MAAGTYEDLTIHLVLTHHWFDEMVADRKDIEYRAMTPHWKKLIWDRRKKLVYARFSRGYTKTTITRPILDIDIGPCPIPGWEGNYYRIHLGYIKEKSGFPPSKKGLPTPQLLRAAKAPLSELMIWEMSPRESVEKGRFGRRLEEVPDEKLRDVAHSYFGSGYGPSDRVAEWKRVMALPPAGIRDELQAEVDDIVHMVISMHKFKLPGSTRPSTMAHYRAVKKAVASGFPVPSVALEAYPDLQEQSQSLFPPMPRWMALHHDHIKALMRALRISFDRRVRKGELKPERRAHVLQLARLAQRFLNEAKTEQDLVRLEEHLERTLKVLRR